MTTSTQRYGVVDPTTGELVKEYPTATDQEVDAALAGAATAFATWSKSTTVARRAELLHNVADLHEARSKELAETIQREMGKPLDQAVGEVEFCAAIYRYYADRSEEHTSELQSH